MVARNSSTFPISQGSRPIHACTLSYTRLCCDQTYKFETCQDHAFDTGLNSRQKEAVNELIGKLNLILAQFPASALALGAISITIWFGISAVAFAIFSSMDWQDHFWRFPGPICSLVNFALVTHFYKQRAQRLLDTINSWNSEVRSSNLIII